MKSVEDTGDAAALFVGLSVYYSQMRAAEIITAQMCDDILHRIFKNAVQLSC